MYGKKFTHDSELIKDTIQDLFFDLLRMRNNLGETDSIKFYLLTSFRRKLNSNFQKQSKFVNHKIDDLELTIVYSAERELMDKESLSQRDKLIQNALKNLSPKQREILYYRFTCNFEYEQICDIMSLKYDSARKLVFRALKSLKKLLSNNEIIILFLGSFSKK
ncbi:MAG: sigma-70 family RNA polymerase sigma factor [Draconibacterium sp.]|nr:sigma-70 family RNA polymerase sigma factor [Draconibacterium sp.]